jgi:hypothetical protein
MEEKGKSYFKKPSECTEKEINRFHELVLEGGKVQKQGLLDRIKNCYLLGFYTLADEIIGVSSLKQPSLNYRQSVIEHHKLDRTVEQLAYEIGYSFTISKYRKQGISAELKAGLLENSSNLNAIIFSTTAIASSQNFLSARGFSQVGIPYDGENDAQLCYYERNQTRKDPS